MLKRMKNRLPILFGIVTALLYLVILTLLPLLLVALGVEITDKNVYLLQFLATAAASVFMILIVWRIGYGWIFTTKSRGFLYNVGTGGYPLTVCGIALASNLGTYLLVEGHVFRMPLPFLEILSFTLAMLGIGFAEELVFRGILTNLLREKYSTKTDQGIFTVLFIQGAIFGVCHMGNVLSGVKLESAIVQAIMAGLLGVMLGAIYLRTNSFWFVAFLHGLNDFCALIASGLYGLDNMSETINSYSWFNLAGAPLYITVCCILLRRSKRREIKGEQVQELPLYWRIIKGVLLACLSCFLIMSVFVSNLVYSLSKGGA